MLLNQQNHPHFLRRCYITFGLWKNSEMCQTTVTVQRVIDWAWSGTRSDFSNGDFLICMEAIRHPRCINHTGRKYYIFRKMEITKLSKLIMLLGGKSLQVMTNNMHYTRLAHTLSVSNGKLSQNHNWCQRGLGNSVMMINLFSSIKLCPAA